MNPPPTPTPTPTSTETPAPWYVDGIHFSCTQCGNCCTGPSGYVWFTEDEAKVIAASLQVSLSDFYHRYAHPIRKQWSLNEVKTERGYDCVFLKRDEKGRAGCSIYPVRPRQCRTWPFWEQNLESPQDWLQAGARCPGMQAGMMGKGKHYTLQQIRIIRDDIHGSTGSTQP